MTASWEFVPTLCRGFPIIIDLHTPIKKHLDYVTVYIYIYLLIYTHISIY